MNAQMIPQASAAYEVRGVGHTGITVSDIARSVDFYRNVLGLPVTDPIRVTGPAVARITGVPGAEIETAFVHAPGYAIELIMFVKPDDRLTFSLRACDPGFMHLCFKVRAIEHIVEAVCSGGFEPQGEIQTLTEGPVAGARVVYVRDPDGVCLEFIEEPPGLAFEKVILQSARK